MEAHGLPVLPPARYPRCVQVQTFTYKCITKMPEYANKSLEELRYEDYVKGGRLASVICSVSGVLASELSIKSTPRAFPDRLQRGEGLNRNLDSTEDRFTGCSPH